MINKASWFLILLWLPPLLHHWNSTCFFGIAPASQQRSKVKIKTFLSKWSGEQLRNTGFVNSYTCVMIWKYTWLRVQSTASEKGSNCFGDSRANSGLHQLKIFLEVVGGFSSIKITSWDTSFLRCFVQLIVQPEQNRLASQCNEHQKSLLSKTQVVWAVLRPEPARSSPGVCRALEDRSLTEVWPAGSHVVLPAGWHTHSFGKARGNFKRGFQLKQASLAYSGMPEPLTVEA